MQITNRHRPKRIIGDEKLNFFLMINDFISTEIFCHGRVTSGFKLSAYTRAESARAYGRLDSVTLILLDKLGTD